jgi:hypothetical protein
MALDFIWDGAWGSPAYDYGINVETDSSNNVYWCGQTGAVDFGNGIVGANQSSTGPSIAKFDSSKKNIWGYVYGEPIFGVVGRGTGQGNAIAVDPSGKSVFVGYFAGQIKAGATILTSTKDSQGNYTNDVFVIKYDSDLNGTPLWAVSFGGTGTADVATGVALDSNSDIWVCGTYGGSAGGSITFGANTYTTSGIAIFLAKLSNTNGSVLFSASFGGSDSLYDASCGVAVDSSNNVVMSGTIDAGENVGGSALVRGAFLAKYSSAGGHIWSQGFGGEPIYVTAPSVNKNVNKRDYIALSGGFSKTITFNGATLTDSHPAQSIFAVTFKPDGSSDYVTPTTFAKKFGTLVAYSNRPAACLYDANGNIFIYVTIPSGSTMDFGGGTLPQGPFTVCLGEVDSLGGYIAQRSMFGTGLVYGGSGQTPGGLAVDTAGNAIVTGSYNYQFDPSGGSNYLPNFGNQDVWIGKYGSAVVLQPPDLTKRSDGTNLDFTFIQFPSAEPDFSTKIGIGFNPVYFPSGASQFLVKYIFFDGTIYPPPGPIGPFLYPPVPGFPNAWGAVLKVAGTPGLHSYQVAIAWADVNGNQISAYCAFFTYNKTAALKPLNTSDVTLATFSTPASVTTVNTPVGRLQKVTFNT